MSTGAASPAFVWSRLGPSSRTLPRFFAGLKCQHKLTTALKAILTSHITNYHKDVRVRWSQLNTSVGPRYFMRFGNTPRRLQVSTLCSPMKLRIEPFATRSALGTCRTQSCRTTFKSELNGLCRPSRPALLSLVLHFSRRRHGKPTCTLPGDRSTAALTYSHLRHWSELTSFARASGLLSTYESKREKSAVRSLPHLWS